MDPHPVDSVRPSGRWLRLVRRDEFTRLLGAAIEAALVRRGGLAPEHARALRLDALQRFGRAFGPRTRRVRALTKQECLAELERTHGALLRRHREHGSELAQLELSLRKARAGAPVLALAPEQEAALARALGRDIEALLGAPDPRAALAQVLAREAERRGTALNGLVRHEQARIDVLERRLVKLRAALGEMERQLAELARRAELDPGLPSIYASVQGLPADEAEREAKAQMLARIYEQNVHMQQRLA